MNDTVTLENNTDREKLKKIKLKNGKPLVEYIAAE
jgi:hypothetical protein